MICGRSSKNLKKSIVVAFICAGIAVAIILGIRCMLDYKYSSNIQNISDADTFVAAMAENTKKKEKDAQYDVRKSFSLNKEHLKQLARIDNYSEVTGVWFYGTLNGNGNTITVTGSASAPLFEQVCDGAKICRLNIAFAEGVYVQSSTKECSALTRRNNGTIEDVKLSATIKVNKDSKAVGGVCVHNSGTIQRCYVKVNYGVPKEYWTEGGKLVATTWNCYVGAIAAYNYSSKEISRIYISSSFSRYTLEDNPTEDSSTYIFPVIALRQYNESGDKNTTIGYAFGSNYYNNSKISDVIVLSEGKNVIDVDGKAIRYGEIGSTFDSSIWTSWTIQNGELELSESTGN